MRLTVADEFSVDRLFLRVEVIAKNLVEAIQTHAGCLLCFVIANRGPAPDALDHERLFRFLFVHHLPPYL
jgi:hypothetical protein